MPFNSVPLSLAHSEPQKTASRATPARPGDVQNRSIRSKFRVRLRGIPCHVASKQRNVSQIHYARPYMWITLIPLRLRLQSTYA